MSGASRRSSVFRAGSAMQVRRPVTGGHRGREVAEALARPAVGAYLSAASAPRRRGRFARSPARGGRAIIEVAVRDNNIDHALRALKKKMQREGLYREMRMRRFYEKPSERRARERAEAIRRYRKLMKKRMERDEL